MQGKARNAAASTGDWPHARQGCGGPAANRADATRLAIDTAVQYPRSDSAGSKSNARSSLVEVGCAYRRSWFSLLIRGWREVGSVYRAGKVIVEQLPGDVCSCRIGRRRGNLCGHEGA